MSRGHRRLVVVEDPVAARAAVAALDPTRVAWLATRAEARHHLGATLDAVVLDLRDGVDPELLGMAQGLPRGGGLLVWLRSPDARGPMDLRAALLLDRRGAPPPSSPPALGAPTASRDTCGGASAPRPTTSGSSGPTQTSGSPDRRGAPPPSSPPALGASRPDRRGALPPSSPPALGAPTKPEEFAWTVDQQRALDALRASLAGAPSRTALLADRGRGKSTVLGQLAAEVAGAVVTSPEPTQAAQVRSRADVPWVALAELLDAPPSAHPLILVDEAAGFPVAALRALLARHPDSHVVLASTVQGYEGSGRGFLLRFLAEAGHVRRIELSEPVRWAPDDPVEQAVGRVLAWDARPAADPVGPVDLRVVGGAELATDEGLLGEVFGLLVHAHYRTTPTDLRTLLEPDPNVAVHVASTPGGVAGVGLVSREGGLTPERCRALAAGRERIRGHALADTLICHAGHPEAGELPIARSVRLAVHPARRREGLAARIVAHEHEVHADAELFGTLFGGTAEVIRLRRRLGYALVRVGAARGGRSGEVSVVMALGRSERARALVDRLRAELARDWPMLRELLRGDGALTDAGVLAAIDADLPAPAPFEEEQALRTVSGWLDGPRPFEAAAPSLRWLRTRGALPLERLDTRQRALLEGRLTRAAPWRSLLDHVDGHSVPAAMRALKAAVREVLVTGDCNESIHGEAVATPSNDPC